LLAPATTYPQGSHAGATGQSQRRLRRGRGRSPWRGLFLCSAAFSPSSNFLPSSFCFSSGFGRSVGGGGTRRDSTPPARSTWTEAAVASTACALLPAGRFVVPRGSSRWRNRPKPTPLAPRPRLLSLARA